MCTGNNNFTPHDTRHPSIQNATWTKVDAVAAGIRRQLIIANEDATNAYRIAIVRVGAGAPASASAGQLLPVGMSYVEDLASGISLSDVYAYQASGGALATLAVTEGE